MAATKLNKAEKEQVRKWLAQFYTLNEAKTLVEQTFGKEVTIQTIHFYRQKYINEIEEAQKKFLEEIGKIPEANKTVRLHRLGKIARRLLYLLNIPEAHRTVGFLELAREYRAILRQIAEETGGLIQRIDASLSGEVKIITGSSLKDI